jgi:hypothetical protein
MIRFDCECGKLLKAPPDLAGNVGCCPVCRACVAVPHPLASDSAEVENAEVYALAAQPPVETDASSQPCFVPPTTPRTPMKQDPIEAWIASQRSTVFVAGISGVLSLLTALGVEVYQRILQPGQFWLSGMFLAVGWIGIVAVVAGYGCRYLDAVLERETRGGGGKQVEPPVLDPGPALASFMKWGLCFVAGPAFLFYEALRFWIQCGDMTIVNGLILAELTVPALCYWLIGVIVLNEQPESVVPSPWRVLKAIRGFGLRAVPAGFVLTGAAGIHLWLAVNSLVLLDSSWLQGVILLWICWFSAWHCGALAARTLGRWLASVRQGQVEPSNFSAAA